MHRSVLFALSLAACWTSQPEAEPQPYEPVVARIDVGDVAVFFIDRDHDPATPGLAVMETPGATSPIAVLKETGASPLDLFVTQNPGVEPHPALVADHRIRVDREPKAIVHPGLQVKTPVSWGVQTEANWGGGLDAGGNPVLGPPDFCADWPPMYYAWIPQNMESFAVPWGGWIDSNPEHEQYGESGAEGTDVWVGLCNNYEIGRGTTAGTANRTLYLQFRSTGGSWSAVEGQPCTGMLDDDYGAFPLTCQMAAQTARGYHYWTGDDTTYEYRGYAFLATGGGGGNVNGYLYVEDNGVPVEITDPMCPNGPPSQTEIEADRPDCAEYCFVHAELCDNALGWSPPNPYGSYVECLEHCACNMGQSTPLGRGGTFLVEDSPGCRLNMTLLYGECDYMDQINTVCEGLLDPPEWP